MSELMPAKTVVITRQKDPCLDEDEIHFPFYRVGKPIHDYKWFIKSISYLIGIKKYTPIQENVMNILKKNNVEVVLSEYLDASLKWLDVAQSLGIRFFAHAFGYDISQTLCNPDMRRRYLKLEEADGIITVSEHSRIRLMDLGLSENKIHVIPCGVNVPGTAPLHQQGNHPIRCLVVGRMVAKKAPLMVLEAFRRSLLENSRLKMDYVGDGELFDEASQFVSDHDLSHSVTLHGSQPNRVVHELMKKADIFIQHSRTDPLTGDEEGLPVAILDSMANGLPVVSTRHAGIPEAVIEGVTGYLVDEGDVESMAAYIIQLADDAKLRKRFGQAGWARAKQNFSWEKEKAALLKVLGLETLMQEKTT